MHHQPERGEDKQEIPDTSAADIFLQRPMRVELNREIPLAA
jgi:hypothetical protein